MKTELIKLSKLCLGCFGMVVVTAMIVGCSEGGATSSSSAAPTGITPQQMADALFTVMASDRAVYTKKVVQRLQNEEKVIRASEHWQDDKALPLPAQMFRMGAETVAEKNAGFTYSLLSLWPINKQNAATTDAEKVGLQFVADSGGKTNYYTEETLGGQKYFTAVYADVAVSKACVSCHNNHDDTPKDDFEIDDVMGGVVLRIPIDS